MNTIFNYVKPALFQGQELEILRDVEALDLPH
jgi:hypothetical protein